MKKYWKRMLAMVMAVTMVVPSVPVQAETMVPEWEVERGNSITVSELAKKLVTDKSGTVSVRVTVDVNGEQVSNANEIQGTVDEVTTYFIDGEKATGNEKYMKTENHVFAKGTGSVEGALNEEGKKKLADLEQAAGKKDTEVERLTTETARALSASAQASAAKTLAQATLTSKENALTKAQEDLTAAQTNLTNAQAKVTEKENELANFEENIEKLKVELAQKKADLEADQAKLAEQKAAYEDAKEAISNAESLLESAKTKLAQASGLPSWILEVLKKAVSEAETTLEKVKEKNQATIEEYEALEKSIEDQKDEIDKRQSELDSEDPEAQKAVFEKAVEEAQKAVEDAKTAVTEAENAVTTATTERDNAKTAYDEADKKATAASTVYETAKSNLETAKTASEDAWAAVKEFIQNDLTINDLTFNPQAVIYSEASDDTYTYHVIVYDVLTIKTEGATADITVNNADAKITDNQYKVLEGNSNVTVKVPDVESYNLVNVTLGNTVLTENEGVYVVGALTENTTLIASYAEETASVVDTAAAVSVEGVKSVKVNDKEIATFVKVDEDTEVKIEIEAADNYSLSKLSVKDSAIGDAVAETTEATLTFKSGAKKTYIVNVEMEKLNNCTLTLGTGTNGTVKYTKGSEEAVELTETVNLLKNTEYTVTVEPAEGFFVTSLEVETAVEKIAESVASTITFTTGDGKDYIVSYECKEPTLVLNDGFILATDLTSADLEEKIFKAVYDTENSLPNNLTIDKVKVEYKAGTITIRDKSYDIWNDINVESVTSESLLKMVAESTGISKALLKTLLGNTMDSILSNFHAFGENGDGSEEIVRITFAGDEIYPKMQDEATVTISDTRVATEIIGNENVTITYGFTEDDLYEALNLTVVAKSAKARNSVGEPIGQKATFVTDVESLNASENPQIVKVKYDGDDTYQPCTAEFEIIIKKAPVELLVDSANIRYADINGSYNAEKLVTVNPSADYISFAVGLGLGNNASADAGTIAYVDIPELIDLDSIENETVKGYIQATLDKLGNGTSMSVAELKAALEGFLSTAEDAENILGFLDINLNLDSINSLVSVLEQIEDLEGIGNLTVKLTMDKGLNISDAGVYLVGAVTSDVNYETAYGLNYLIITPNGKKAELNWIIEDENGFVTIGALTSGEYDLGAYVSKVYEGTVSDAEKQLVELFLGVDAEGNPILTTDQSELTFGAYTEIAFIKDLGNEMYYAVPIVRPVVVVADLVDVKFVGLNGNENYDCIFTFDGTQKAMVAEAYDRAGNKLDSNNITYRYIGIESDAEGYYSSEAPTETGAYTVVAVYKEANNTRVGMAAGAMLIQPAEAVVAVDNAKHVYDGKPYDVDQMIESTPVDAKIAVITAGVVIEGGELSSTTGEINIDLPERAETVFEAVFGRALDTYVIDKEDFIQAVNELKAALEDASIDASAIDEILAVMDQIPDVMKLTFKDQKDVNPSEIGIYFVGAVVFDPNYVPEAGAGILVITPEDVHVDFEPDLNVDNAREFVYDGEPKEMPVVVKYFGRSEEPAGTLEVTYIGVDSQGNEWNSTEAPTNVGVYSVIAVYEEYEGEKLVAYGANVGAMLIKPADVDVKIAIDDILCGCGCDSNTCAEKCTAETDCGCDLDVLDKIEITAVKSEELKKIAVITDEEGNVNILLPEDWDVESSVTENTVDETIAAIIEEIAKVETVAASETVSKAIASVIEQLANIETGVLDTEAKKVINKVVEELEAINTATVKATLNTIIEEVKALGLDSKEAVNTAVALLESLKTETEDAEIAATIEEIVNVLESVDTNKLDTAAKAALGAVVAMVKDLDLTELKEAAKTSIDAIVNELEAIDTSILTTEADKVIATVVEELTALKEKVESAEPEVESITSQLLDVLSEIEENVGKINSLSINGAQNYTCGIYNVYALAFGPNHKVGYKEAAFKIYPPTAEDDTKEDDDDDKKPSGGSGSGNSGSENSKDDSGKELEGVYAAPTVQPSTTGTSTGDSANILGYVSLIAVAGIALVLLFFKKRRV